VSVCVCVCVWVYVQICKCANVSVWLCVCVSVCVALLPKVPKQHLSWPRQHRNGSERPAHLTNPEPLLAELLAAAAGGAASSLAALPRSSRSHGGPSFPMTTCESENKQHARRDTERSCSLVAQRPILSNS
jgi:hypothetical protein